MSLPTEIDQALAQLRANGYPDLQLDASPTPVGGGFWAEIWLLPVAAAGRGDLPSRLVMRMPPDAQLAAWETTFQAGVADQGYPTPRIRAFNFQPHANERAWSVMDFSDGTPILGGLSGPRALVALPRLATGLPDTLARAAAELHQLDPEPVRVSLAQASPRLPGIDGLLDHYRTRARELADTRLQRVVDKLTATKPASTQHVLCHGDLHPFNVLTTDIGYVVLDWTNGQVIHPEFDLAFTHLLVSNPPLKVPMPLRPALNATARRLGNRFLKTYRALSPHGVDSDRLDWFRTLHSCRVSLDLEGWRAGGTLDQHPGHPWFILEPAVARLLAG